jgi:translation elongation factor EF-Tu-like GTPase
MAWFRHDKNDSLDTQDLLAKAHEATPLESPPPPSLTKPTTGFRMTVEDVFTIKGRGTVLTGRVEAGSVSNGATVRLTRAGGAARDVEVAGIEMFRKQVETASAGDRVGLLLRGIDRDDVDAGDVLSV